MKFYARLLLKKSRGQPTLSFTCNAIGVNFIPGDFIRCNFTTLKINDVYRIIETSINTDHTVSLTAIKHDPEFYDITSDGNKFVARKILPISLSYDHRVIDGADAARFTKLLSEIISKPNLLVNG